LQPESSDSGRTTRGSGAATRGLYAPRDYRPAVCEVATSSFAQGKVIALNARRITG
jgi:hypothetical protein